MWKLDLHIWNISNHGEAANDALIWWVIKDISAAIDDSAWAVASIIAPSTKAIAENTAYVTRHWGKNWIFNLSNWKKLALTLPTISADIAMKAKNIPAATLSKWYEIVLSNNLERVIWAAKWVTTTGLANWITSNWETQSKSLQLTWDIIEWAGDLIWDVPKAAVGLVWLWLNKFHKYVWNIWVPSTDKWTKDLRISDKDFFKPILQNSGQIIGEVNSVDFWKAAANDDNLSAATG